MERFDADSHLQNVANLKAEKKQACLGPRLLIPPAHKTSLDEAAGK